MNLQTAGAAHPLHQAGCVQGNGNDGVGVLLCHVHKFSRFIA